MKTTKYTSVYISMFNESIVPLLYYVYLINPQFKLYCFFCFVLVHLSRRLKCTIVIMRCPSSVVVNFSHFDFSETAKRNSMKLDRKQDLNVLYQVCVFRADRKTRWPPGLWLAETFSTSPLKPLNGIQWNLTGSKISRSSTKFVFFGPIGKTGWPPWPLISWDILDFSSKTAERNSTKLDKKKDLNVLYKVCVFWADQKNRMAGIGQSVKKVAHCTQVHDMWPFGPLVFFFFLGGGHIVPISQNRGRCVSLCFSVKSEWNIWDIDIAHESDYLEFLHKIMEVIRCQKSRHAVM